MGEVVTFPGRSTDPAAARNLAGVAQARAALRRGRARAIDLDVDEPGAAAGDPGADGEAGARGRIDALAADDGRS